MRIDPFPGNSWSNLYTSHTHCSKFFEQVLYYLYRKWNTFVRQRIYQVSMYTLWEKKSIRITIYFTGRLQSSNHSGFSYEENFTMCKIFERKSISTQPFQNDVKPSITVKVIFQRLKMNLYSVKIFSVFIVINTSDFFELEFYEEFKKIIYYFLIRQIALYFLII